MNLVKVFEFLSQVLKQVFKRDIGISRIWMESGCYKSGGIATGSAYDIDALDIIYRVIVYVNLKLIFDS